MKLLEENTEETFTTLDQTEISQDTKSANHQRQDVNEMDLIPNDFHEIESQNFPFTKASVKI